MECFKNFFLSKMSIIVTAFCNYMVFGYFVAVISQCFIVFFSCFATLCGRWISIENVSVLPRLAPSQPDPFTINPTPPAAALNCCFFMHLLFFMWVRGVMVTGVGFEFRDRSSNPILCQITDGSLRRCLH